MLHTLYTQSPSEITLPLPLSQKVQRGKILPPPKKKQHKKQQHKNTHKTKNKNKKNLHKRGTYAAFALTFKLGIRRERIGKQPPLHKNVKFENSVVREKNR